MRRRPTGWPRAGITAGCAPRRFCPGDSLTSGPARFCPRDPARRDQMATFLARALGLTPTRAVETTRVIWSFGRDGHGELYVLTRWSVHKIVPR